MPLRSHGSLSLDHALMAFGSQRRRIGRCQLRSPRSLLATGSSGEPRRYGSACVYTSPGKPVSSGTRSASDSNATTLPSALSDGLKLASD